MHGSDELGDKPRINANIESSPDSNIAIGQGAIAAAGDVYININNHPISNKVVDEESSIGTEDDGLIESNQSFSSSEKLDEMRTGSNFLNIHKGKNNISSNVYINGFWVTLGLVWLAHCFYRLSSTTVILFSNPNTFFPDAIFLGDVQYVFFLLSNSAAMYIIKQKTILLSKNLVKLESSMNYSFQTDDLGIQNTNMLFLYFILVFTWVIGDFHLLNIASVPFCILWVVITRDINKVGLLTFPNISMIYFATYISGIILYDFYAFGYSLLGNYFWLLMFFFIVLLIFEFRKQRQPDEFEFQGKEFLCYKNIIATKKLQYSQKSRAIYPLMSKNSLIRSYSYFIKFGIPTNFVRRAEYDDLKRKNLNFNEYLDSLEEIFLKSDQRLTLFSLTLFLAPWNLLYLNRKIELYLNPSSQDCTEYLCDLIQKTASVSSMNWHTDSIFSFTKVENAAMNFITDTNYTWEQGNIPIFGIRGILPLHHLTTITTDAGVDPYHHVPQLYPILEGDKEQK